MPTKTLPSPAQRNLALDAGRAVAIAAVILIHVCAPLVTGYKPGNPQFFFGNLFDALARIAVPLFVMISGALMLNEDTSFSLKKLFLKKIPQLLLPLIVWSAVYALHYKILTPLSAGKPIDWADVRSAFFMGHYHLWYLYMQIGLYLILPFLRAFVKKENKHLVLLYIGLTLLTQFTVPVLNSVALYWRPAKDILTFMDKFYLDFFSQFVAYYLTGWYVVHVGISKKWKRLFVYALSLLVVLATILYVNATKDYKNAYSDWNLFNFLYTLGVFLAVSRHCTALKGVVRAVVLFISRHSFGMYVVHVLIIRWVKSWLPKTLFPPVYILACFAIVFAVSLLITFVLSKIPGIRKLVRG